MGSERPTNVWDFLSEHALLLLIAFMVVCITLVEVLDCDCPDDADDDLLFGVRVESKEDSTDAP